MEKEISREQFNNMLLSSLQGDMSDFNSQIATLGVVIKPYIGYEYYIGNDFICSTEDLCVDDIIEAAGYRVEEL